jgi:DNA-binding MarR family transcriptional regulator
MTVGGVADLLAVDPSVASRMVSDCISGGYLERMASPYTYSTDTPPGLDKSY